MFENLTDKLQRVFKNLRGQGKLTQEHVDEALAGIREALLEGDVNVGVIDELLTHIRDKALGSEVLLQLSPDQQVIKIVRDELALLLGKHAKPIFSSRPPSVWMIVGLQGSGKTTTTGKLAKWISAHGHRPIVVSTDVYRPAAREQLSQVAKAVHVPCWPGAGTDKPLEIVRGAIREAKLSAHDVILVDTRTHPGGNSICGGRHDRAGRSPFRGRISQEARPDWRCLDEARRRRARRRGAFHRQSNRRAREVRGHG
jgi:signal recognition particle subunit SRP54